MNKEKSELEQRGEKIPRKNILLGVGGTILALGLVSYAIIQAEQSSLRKNIEKGTGLLLKKEAPRQGFKIIIGETSANEAEIKVKPFDELKKMSQKKLFRYYDQVNVAGKAEMEKCFRESLSHAIKTLLATPEIDFPEYLTEYQVPGNCFADEVMFEEREENWAFCKEQVLGTIINDGFCLEEVNRKLDSLGLTLKDLAVGIRLKMKRQNLKNSL